MSRLPEWLGAPAIAAHYGLTPEYIWDTAAANRIRSFDLPATRRNYPWGPTLFNTKDIDDVIQQGAEKREHAAKKAFYATLEKNEEGAL